MLKPRFMFDATVNQKIFHVDLADDGFSVNGQPFRWDLSEVSAGYFHILYENQSFTAEVVKADAAAKSFVIKVNGSIYHVAVKDKFDLLLEKMGMNSNASSRVNSVKAPMPGLIIDLKVKAGDTVKAGDSLLILEAMKMENIIKSQGDGVVKNVKVKKGESVEKNQVLIEF